MSALAAWSELSWEEQVPRLIAGLGSEVEATALFCAKALPLRCLSLEEVRLQCAVLVRHPAEVFETSEDAGTFRCIGARSLGAPDVVPLLAAAIEQGTPASESSVSALHRVMGPEHIAPLVELLEPARGEMFEHLVWFVRGSPTTRTFMRTSSRVGLRTRLQLGGRTQPDDHGRGSVTSPTRAPTR